MSSSKITTQIHKRLLAIYLYCFIVSIAAAFSLSAQATSAFLISFPQLDSPFEGIALTDILFANYLNEKPNKKWAEPYMFLPQRDDHFFVYPVIQGNFNEDENKAVSPDHPEGASAPDKCEDVPENAPAHDEPESNPEGASAYDEAVSSLASISVHDESEDEPESTTALNSSVYRSWLLEQVQRIGRDFFVGSILEVDPSLINDQRLTEIFNSNFHNLPDDAIEKFKEYLQSLTIKQLNEWFSHLLKLPSEIFLAFFTSFPESLSVAALPTIFEFLHEQERGISMQENEYYQQLSSGHLPRQQPPQRSFILTPEDFQGPEALTRMNIDQAILLRKSGQTHRVPRQLTTPEECYQIYLECLISTFFNDPDKLIVNAKAFYYKIIHHKIISSSHPLWNEYGLLYVPSERWLSRVVEAIGQQVGENPVGLEIDARSGSLSYFLNSHYNMPMTATDNSSCHQWIKQKTNDNLRADVIRADAATAVRNHPEANFLVISWPDFFFAPSHNLEPIIPNLPGRDDPSYEMFREYIQRYYPVLAAILEWNDRGPILFIGELHAHSYTGSEPLRAYLQQHFDAISFRDFYQPLPCNMDYPTLFVPKTKDQSGKPAGKDKDGNKSRPS